MGFLLNNNPMKINILPFGALTDILPAVGLAFSNDTISSVAQLHEYLAQHYPAIARLNFRYAVNQELVDDRHPIQEGDEVALLPPFSGG